MFYISIHRYCGNLFFAEVCSRQFCLLTAKVRKFLPLKFLPLKYHCTGEQDTERRLKTSFHSSNISLNNVVSSACLLLQNLHGVPNVLLS